MITSYSIKGDTLTVDADGGSITVFLRGIQPIGRLGDDWKPPYMFVLPKIDKPTSVTLVIEQWKGPKMVDKKEDLVVLQPPAIPVATAFGVCHAHDKILKTLPALKALKPKYNRVWVDPGNFDKIPSIDREVNVLRTLGAIPIYCVCHTRGGVKDMLKAPSWFDRFVQYIRDTYDASDDTKGTQIVVEMWNEPDLEPDVFWMGTMQEYIDYVLKPICPALKLKHGDRITILSGGFAWDWTTFDHYAGQIALYVDGFAYHGYADSLNALNRYKIVLAVARKYGKKLWITEYTLGYGKLYKACRTDEERAKVMANWLRDTGPALAQLIDLGIDVICFFVTVSIGSTNSRSCLFTDDGANTPLYDAVLATLKLKGLA